MALPTDALRPLHAAAPPVCLGRLIRVLTGYGRLIWGTNYDTEYRCGARQVHPGYQLRSETGRPAKVVVDDDGLAVYSAYLQVCRREGYPCRRHTTPCGIPRRAIPRRAGIPYGVAPMACLQTQKLAYRDKDSMDRARQPNATISQQTTCEQSALRRTAEPTDVQPTNTQQSAHESGTAPLLRSQDVQLAARTQHATCNVQPSLHASRDAGCGRM